VRRAPGWAVGMCSTVGCHNPSPALSAVKYRAPVEVCCAVSPACGLRTGRGGAARRERLPTTLVMLPARPPPMVVGHGRDRAAPRAIRRQRRRRAAAGARARALAARTRRRAAGRPPARRRRRAARPGPAARLRPLAWRRARLGLKPQADALLHLLHLHRRRDALCGAQAVSLCPIRNLGGARTAASAARARSPSGRLRTGPACTALRRDHHAGAGHAAGAMHRQWRSPFACLGSGGPVRRPRLRTAPKRNGDDATLG